MDKFLSGLKTVTIGLVMIMLPPAVEYIGHIDWRLLVPDQFVWAVPMISGGVMIALRLVTKTAVFQKAASVDPADPALGGLQ